MTYLAAHSDLSARSEKTDASFAKTQALVVGEWQGREFARATFNIPSARDWQQAADIDEACDLLLTLPQPPELIFLAQPLPGQFCQEDIDRLQILAPLTRLVIVVGSWCEGELRTGSPPHGVIRLYWYDLASWWRAATRRRDAGQCPLWSLPLDHLQAGRWSPAQEVLHRDKTAHSVVIHAADYATYEALSAALEDQNIKSYWQGRDENATLPATAGIWDGGQLSQRELAHLTKFCRQISGPVITLLDFPRLEHFSQAQAAGASSVFAKPYVVEELVLALTTPPTLSAKSRVATLARAPASSESD